MWSSLIGFGGSLGLSALNGVFSGISNKQAAKKAYKYAKRLAAQQFEYNKTMMQSRHQWEVDDLRAAGLNPILSAGGGGAAGSTGSGGSVNVQPANYDFTSALSAFDGLRNSSVNRSLTGAQKSAVDIKADIDREKLKQERLKTEYIRRDPTYFTPSKSVGDVVRGLLFPSAARLKEMNKPVQDTAWGQSLLKFIKSAWDWNKRYTPVYNFYQQNRYDSGFDKSLKGSEFLRSKGR